MGEIFFHPFTAASGGVFSQWSSYFGHFKNPFLSSVHQILQDKKDYKTKKFPFDDIDLEYGLRFELEPLLKALEPKN